MCLTSNIAIFTSRGEVPAGSLKVGDRVFTRDNGPQKIDWIGRHDLTALHLERHKDLMPVLIEKGALGGDLPERDLVVSPEHRLLLAADREALYAQDHDTLSAAKHLVGLPGIYRFKPLEISYVHFQFEQAEVVLTNGFWSECFQPAAMSSSGHDADARDEVYRLFPQLADRYGVKGYGAGGRMLTARPMQVSP
ncbi:Hint domain-containing protein [Celeribacter sp.]|uniref:Hint domain-containing protein n=1 Tax=Celeribacter sp. TaxID=1890673 RepID=UPI003A91C0D4